MSAKSRWFWGSFVSFVAMDQAAKVWVGQTLLPLVDEVDLIPGFLSVVHVQNPGAAFGLFTGFAGRQYLFLAFTLIALWVVGDLYRKLDASDRFHALALGLVLSGTVGNAIDRALRGTVTDFIRVHADHGPLRAAVEALFHVNEYPTFNIADAALLVGVGMFVARSLVHEAPAAAPAAGD